MVFSQEFEKFDMRHNSLYSCSLSTFICFCPGLRSICQVTVASSVRQPIHKVAFLHPFFVISVEHPLTLLIGVCYLESVFNIPVSINTEERE